MGIYDSGDIFGIRIYCLHDDDGFDHTLFEQKYNYVMTDEQKKDAYVFYAEWINKDELRFQYYTECSSSYGQGSYFMWYPLSLNMFLEKFGG